MEVWKGGGFPLPAANFPIPSDWKNPPPSSQPGKTNLLHHFNFLCFVHTDHTNFDLNQCSTFTESCF